MTLDRLGQQRVNAAPFDLFRYQTDADEHRDEEPEDRGRR